MTTTLALAIHRHRRGSFRRRAETFRDAGAGWERDEEMPASRCRSASSGSRQAPCT